VIAHCLQDGVHLELLGRLWCEPLTSLTDALLALQLLWYAKRTRGSARLWFVLMAAGFTLGGARHLLHHQLPELTPLLSRVQNIAGSSALALLAALLDLGGSVAGQRRAQRLYMAVAALFLVGHLVFDLFLLTVTHQTLALLGAAGWVLLQGRAREYRAYLIHVGLGLLCAVIFLLRLAPHPWFDHNALAHVIMLGAFATFHAQLRSLGWSR
jgi:hypothetical protein